MRIRVLGGFAVHDDEGNQRTPRGRSAQVLKLVVCAGRPLHAEEVVEAIWPSEEEEPDESPDRLGNVLSRLRKRVGPVVMRRDGGLFQLAPGVVVDAEEFDALALRALEEGPSAEGVRLARLALEHYGGDLLPEDRYAEWAEVPRERLRRRLRAVLELLVADARRRGDLERALLLLERAVAMENPDEELGLELVELLDELGRRTPALRMLEQIRRGQEALDLPVSPRWVALDRRLRQGGADTESQ